MSSLCFVPSDDRADNAFVRGQTVALVTIVCSSQEIRAKFTRQKSRHICHVGATPKLPLRQHGAVRWDAHLRQQLRRGSEKAPPAVETVAFRAPHAKHVLFVVVVHYRYGYSCLATRNEAPVSLDSSR